jgi:hypothetical protein
MAQHPRRQSSLPVHTILHIHILTHSCWKGKVFKFQQHKLWDQKQWTLISVYCTVLNTGILIALVADLCFRPSSLLYYIIKGAYTKNKF